MAEIIDVVWPQQQDYDDSMLTMLERVRDDKIKHGKLEQDQANSIVRFGGANNYVTLYRVGGWMIRCFCQDRTREKRPPRDIELRYEYISDFCKKFAKHTTSLSYLEYVPDAIEVDILDRQGANYTLLRTGFFPFVRMEHIKGLSLGTFIAKYHDQRTKMEQLCAAWLYMIQELEQLQMAHGDLDLTNVLVVEKNGQITLKLIDYDNVWIPTFAHLSLEQIEIGHEHFQHPAFVSKKTRSFDQYMDRFSALTIYISLHALTVNPALYTDPQWGVSDAHLLFMKSDYEAEMQSQPNRISQLADQKISDLTDLLQELRLCLRECRQPRSLTEFSIANKGTTQPVVSLGGVQEPSVSHETEYVYFDWSNATRNVDTENAFATSVEQPRANKLRPDPSTWVSSSPSSYTTQQQQQQQVYQEQDSQIPVESQGSSTSTLVWSIFILVLLGILAVVLWFVFTQGHLPFLTSRQDGNDVVQMFMLFTHNKM